jgi:cytochrome c
MMRTLIISVAIFTVSAGATLAQDLRAGEASFRKCQPCHDVGAEARNKMGPILNGMDGNKSGSVDGYSYTDANKNAGITWSEDAFKDYIKDPRAKMPGTKMVFPGIKDEKEAADLWAYLAQFKADGSKK